jgi:hypothetical protein
MADVAGFAERATPKLSEAGRAELELARLQALARAASAIPFDNPHAEPYGSWIRSQGENLVYSDPAGQWFVANKLYWDGARKYRSLPIGDAFAWAGAEAPIPGECEGYLPCALSMVRMSFGEYLALYPKGKHAADALGGILGFAEGVTDGTNSYTSEPGDRADIVALTTELKKIVEKTSEAKTKEALAALDKILGASHE